MCGVFFIADVGVFESAIITSQPFFSWKPGRNKHQRGVSHGGLRTLAGLKPRVGALQILSWQREARSRRGHSLRPKTRSKGEGCLRMWLSLWPLTQRWAICNPNKRRHPGDFFLHNTPLDWNGQLLTLLSNHLATSGVTCFPLRTVYLHRSIFP